MAARVNVKDFDLGAFFVDKISTVKHSRKERYVNVWAAFDTETYANATAGWVVVWSLCVEYQGRQVTVWGRSIDEAMELFDLLSVTLELSDARKIPIYVHNLSYDYVFMRNFMFESFGAPVKALAVKTHRYLTMTLSNGIELKDSYILAQCSLEKWARDLHAPAQKLVGHWDYEKRRTPLTQLTADEIAYVCADAETLVECLKLKAQQGGYGVGSIPLTATGYAREAARSAAFATDWRKIVHRLDMTLPQYLRASDTFQGGLVHGARWYVGSVLLGLESYDFASSYPYVMCTELFPSGPWCRCSYSLRQILRDTEHYGFIFDLLLIGARIKPRHPMPPIAQSKCKEYDKQAVWDNGRLLSASIVLVPANEIDLQIYLDNYDYDGIQIGLYEDGQFRRGMVYTCDKAPLPDWFVQTIVSYFRDKTMKKDSDVQQYQYAKALLNSQYGMTAQRPVRPEIWEDYTAQEYTADNSYGWHVDQPEDPAGMLREYYGRYNYFLPYQWGMYVTSYARRNLYRLGACCRDWVYCDTDSVKGRDWDLEAVASYNKEVLRKLAARGIQPVEYKGRSYSMGIAEHDASYSEFITLGAKRYAYRDAADGQLHITVAGVPKRGVSVLENDIYKFARGLVFHDTGKLIPEYHVRAGIEEVQTEDGPVRVGSWVNLVAADYLLDMTDRFDDLLEMPAEFDRSQ